jgi:hypothetical protein
VGVFTLGEAGVVVVGGGGRGRAARRTRAAATYCRGSDEARAKKQRHKTQAKARLVGACARTCASIGGGGRAIRVKQRIDRVDRRQLTLANRRLGRVIIRGNLRARAVVVWRTQSIQTIQIGVPQAITVAEHQIVVAILSIDEKAMHHDNLPIQRGND